MAKGNPTNPFSRDEGATQREVPMPISKAKVLSARSSDEDGYHTCRIRIYGDNAPYDAPVLPLAIGSAWVPKQDMDVAVVFGSNDKPWVVAPWYAVDRVDDGDVDMPDYEPGEFVLGNHTDSEVRFDNDGNVDIGSGDGDVLVNDVVVEEQIGNPLCIPHTEWSDALSQEEIWRINLDPDERIKVYRVNIALKGGVSADLSLDLYEEETGNVLVSTSGLTTGEPIAVSGEGSTVLARITNNSGDIQIASIDSKLAVERTVE